MNFWVLDTATKFTWSETDLDDDKKQADIDNQITNTTKTMIETKVVTQDQAKEYLVDKNVLPREYLADTGRDGKVLAGGDKQTEDSPESKQQEAKARVEEAKKEFSLESQVKAAEKLYEKIKAKYDK